MKLGIDISERTVSRLLRRREGPSGQTWRTFLANHAPALVSMDFFTVPTITGRILFVLVLLAHQRRRIVHFAITSHPTAEWTAQQIVEAFPDDTAPRWLMRDRDAIYSDAFRRRVTGMGITEVVCAPSSPWQNPYAECLIGSVRRECLDHIIVLGQVHLQIVLARYISYHQRARTHLSLEKDAPVPRRGQPPAEGRVVAFPEVGGLHIATSDGRPERSPSPSQSQFSGAGLVGDSEGRSRTLRLPFAQMGLEVIVDLLHPAISRGVATDRAFA